MYEILLSNKAKSQLKKLPQQIRNRIGSVIERIRIKPFHFIKRKEGTPYYILRVGDYRLILDIKENNIFVIDLGDRKKIYK